MRTIPVAALLGWLLGAAVAPLIAQDSLSSQVLRLLTRNNTWSGTNTYTAGIAVASGAPAVTTNKLYQVGGSLFWNGALVTTASGVGTVTQVALGTPSQFSVSGSPVTSSGTLSFAWNAQDANVALLGPLSGVDAAPTFRAIADEDLPSVITIDSTATVTWASVNKTASSLADLATRSAADLNTGTLPDGRFPATLPAVSGVNLTALSASALASGTVACGRLPALTGDITTTAGACATSLAATAVTAGTYGGAGNLLQLTIDAAGRITAASNVAAATHTLLSTTHTDTVTASPQRGAVIVGNATPAWGRVTPTVAGQVLRYDGTDTAFSTDGSGLTGLNASALSTGTVPVSRGGTGLTAAAANGQLLIGNGTGFTLATLTGTANQVTVTNGAGTITLALPQAIATTSTPQFARVGIGAGADAVAGVLLSGVTESHVEVDDGNSGAADTINWQQGNAHKITLTADCTLTFTAPRAGTWLTLFVTQDATGTRLVTWPTIRWAGGSPPTLTTTASKTDLIRCFYNGTSYFCNKELNF